MLDLNVFVEICKTVFFFFFEYLTCFGVSVVEATPQVQTFDLNLVMRKLDFYTKTKTQISCAVTVQ